MITGISYCNERAGNSRMEYHINHDALKSKVILITGAGDGIGRQAALSYAKHGATVILLGRTLAKLEQVQAEISQFSTAQVMVAPLDLNTATRNDYQSLIERIKAQYGRLDGLLHNAGLLGKLSPFEEINEYSFDEVMQVNVKAELLLTQVALPLIKRSQAGRVIFTSSTVGHSGRSGWGSYAISKFATEGMMQILADELSNTEIRVNAINPGGTRTNMRASAYPNEDPSQLKTPLDIMPLYLYLMSKECEANGQCIDAQPK